jgi:hypothetical protein
MFIELNDLKGLIVDLDSLKPETDKEWSIISDSVKLLFFSNDMNRLNNIINVRDNMYISDRNPFNFFLDITYIIDFLKIMSLHSYEVAFVSGNVENIKNVLDLPLGTILISDSDIADYTRIGYLPDFEVSKIEEINKIISKELAGYFAEVWATIFNRKNYFLSKVTSVIISENELNGYKCSVVCGGRYFNTQDERYKVHQLSQRIIKNKDSMSQNDVFYIIFEKLIRFIHVQLLKVDGVTRVPPRPSEIEKDRFANIVKRICANNGFEELSQEIYCNSDYPTQKTLSAEERLKNVQGKFSVHRRFDGKHVILIDDVISTGATAFECAKVLYENGAGKVTIVVLGVNQLVHPLRAKYRKDLKCKNCGAVMKMKFNSRIPENPAFFGCMNYKSQKCKNSVDYLRGLYAINELSDISTFNTNDIDDDNNF